MNLTSKLQVILNTYNRAPQLRNTLEQIFAPESPIRELDITVQDNHSTDETSALIAEYQKTHPNLKHVVHPHNVGGNGNIVKALERATYDYVWCICDDDTFHWEGWPEVESAIADGAPLICVCRFNIKPPYRDREDFIFNQMTFLPSIIYSRQVLNDRAIQNAYDCVFHWFPHLAPVTLFLNNGGKIRVIEHGLVTPGAPAAPTNHAKESAAVREANDSMPCRARKMNFYVAYANAVMNLNGRDHAEFFSTMVAGDMDRPGSVGGWTHFFREVFFNLDGRENAMHFCDLLMVTPFRIRLILRLIRFCQWIGLVRLLKGSRLYRALRAHADKRNSGPHHWGPTLSTHSGGHQARRDRRRRGLLSERQNA